MKLRVLGCSGGVGAGLRTTSFLVDDDILIDAGSGVGELTLDEMSKLRHLFITHSHLDHICLLPLLVDSIFDRLKEPLLVHAQPATLKALQDHIFNWAIWPDFAKLPTPDKPVMRYVPMVPGEITCLEGRTFEMIPVNHIVPAVGYRVEGPDGSAFAFSGDTTTNDSFWARVNAFARLDLLIVETAFSNADEELSRLARHYCPNTLAADIVKLRHRPPIYLTHNKPGEEQTIFNECTALLPSWNLKQLRGNEIFQL